MEIAHHIVQQCDVCLQYLPVALSLLEVNSQGCLPHHLWQMVMTHVAEFGKLRYVHVTVDAYSGLLLAIA